MAKMEWVAEIPPTVRKRRGSEYDEIIAELQRNPGRIALVASYPGGAAKVKGLVPLRERGAKVSRRTIDGVVHVYAEWPVATASKRKGR